MALHFRVWLSSLWFVLNCSWPTIVQQCFPSQQALFGYSGEVNWSKLKNARGNLSKTKWKKKGELFILFLVHSIQTVTIFLCFHIAHIHMQPNWLKQSCLNNCPLFFMNSRLTPFLYEPNSRKGESRTVENQAVEVLHLEREGSIEFPAASMAQEQLQNVFPG